MIDAASTKPFGFQAFYPGPGVGGHCIPVDPFYLTWKALQYGCTTHFIELAGQVNESMPTFVVTTTERALLAAGKRIADASVLVLGLAYKRDVDDLRESPALDVIRQLRWAGATVFYNDPFFPTVGSGRKYDLKMQSTPLEDLSQYDCVLILTDHSVYDCPGDRGRIEAGDRHAQRHARHRSSERGALLKGNSWKRGDCASGGGEPCVQAG